MVDVNLELNFV